ncbi:MAG: hypothetical protein ACRC8S_04745 [Fimbriiglobus sp.]
MTPDFLDDEIRKHLDAEAKTVDAHAMLARVRGATQPRPRRWRRVAAAIVASGIAACVLLFVFTGQGPAPQDLKAAPTAEELLTEARVAHTANKDFCYEVTTELDLAVMRQMKLEPIVRKSLLWTRGDQFWIETPVLDGSKMAWGQTPDRRVWAAPNRRRGFVFEADEVGEPIARYCEIISLRVVPLLTELLEAFDLAQKPGTDSPDTIRIEAKLRSRPGFPFPRFRSVELELDAQSKTVRRAVLRRQLNGENIGTIHFQFLTSETRPEAEYTLAGHLDPDATIFDKTQTGFRSKLREDFLKRLQNRLK